MNLQTRMLRLQDVIQRTGLSRSQIYRLIPNKEFPSQVSLSDRVVGWVEAEIEQWLQDRISRARSIAEGD
jgi:prophage regulatory protein